MPEHRHGEEEISNDTLVEFRLEKLEDAVSSLSLIKDTVLRWDVKFSSTEGILQCPLHKEKMEKMEIRVKTLEDVVTDLDKFKWKAVGVISGVILVVQVFGSAVIDKVMNKRESNQIPIKIELSVPGVSTNSTFYTTPLKNL